MDQTLHDQITDHHTLRDEVADFQPSFGGVVRPKWGAAVAAECGAMFASHLLFGVVLAALYKSFEAGSTTS